MYESIAAHLLAISEKEGITIAEASRRVARVARKLRTEPKRCYHCQLPQATEAAYTDHLVQVHSYRNDEEAREDAASEVAYQAFAG